MINRHVIQAVNIEFDRSIGSVQNERNLKKSLNEVEYDFFNWSVV